MEKRYARCTTVGELKAALAGVEDSLPFIRMTQGYYQFYDTAAICLNFDEEFRLGWCDNKPEEVKAKIPSTMVKGVYIGEM